MFHMKKRDSNLFESLIMTVIITPPQVYVKDKETVFDKGVFAAKAFKAGELIEVCAVVETPLLDKVKGLPKKFDKILFKWRFLTDGADVEKYCFVLGNAGLYKGDFEFFNIHCKADDTKGILVFFALRDIEKDEELVINAKWRVKVEQLGM